MNEFKKIDNKIHEITVVGKYAHEAMFFARIVIGCLFLYHSLSKFGANTPWFMTLVGLVELVSAVFILVGTRIRTAGFVLGVIMIGAIFTKMFIWKMSFAGKGGWELDLVALALLFVLVTVSSTKYKFAGKHK
jgi:uncharacterized membrane protein YphA (DoxX/SURF4 family)